MTINAGFQEPTMDEEKSAGQAPARFLPASQLDFSRYAKNLAWLLGIKLQPAQELLSRIYGYEHLHELQQALKLGGQPGPYWDHGPAGGAETAGQLGLLCGLPGERSMRPAAVLSDWKRRRGEPDYFDEKEPLIVELGLTDSPESHRACVRRVKAYLQGDAQVDPRGFPCGFWGYMAGYRVMSKAPSPPSSLGNIMQPRGTGWASTSNAPLEPEAQQICVLRDRAFDVLKALSGDVDEIDVKWELDLDWSSDVWGSMWEEMALDDMGEWEAECAAYVFKVSDVFDGEHPWEAMREFVRWPCAARLNECATTIELDTALNRVGQWRLSWMLQVGGDWRSAFGPVVQLNGLSFDEKQRRWSAASGEVDVLLRSRKQDEYDAIELFHLIATMTLEGDAGQTKVVGYAEGWQIVPCKDNFYANEVELEEFIEEHPYLARGWEVAKRYMSIRGIEGMKAWTNAEEGAGVAIVNVQMASGYEAEEWIGKLLALAANAFDGEGDNKYTTAVDAYWRHDLGPGHDNDDVDPEGLIIDSPGLIVASVEGLSGIGMSIADEDAETRHIFVTGSETEKDAFGGRMGRSRFDRDRRAKEKPTSRARKILEALGASTIDVAVLGGGSAEADDS